MKFPKFMIRLNKICAYLCGGTVFGASLLAVMESILRKVFSKPTSWSLNLTQGLFIWAAFLGSVWAIQELGHVSVDMVRDIVDRRSKSPNRLPRRTMAIIGQVPTLFVCAAFFYGGLRLCDRAIKFNSYAPYNFKFPLIISYSAIPVGAVLMFVTVVFIILDLIKGGDKYL